MHVFTVVWNGKVKGVYSDRNLAENTKRKLRSIQAYMSRKEKLLS